MSPRIAPILLASTLLLAAPLAATAQVYKWVDEKGVVNYGDKPPPQSKGAQPFAEGAGSLSVVPGIPKEELGRMRELEAQQRIQRLEREVDELRARQSAQENAVPEVVTTEVYVPVYGYGYPRWPRRPPGAGPPGHRPVHPINRPPSRSQSGKGGPMMFTR